MSVKKTIGCINTEDGKVLVRVHVMRWGRVLELRLSGKDGTQQDGYFFTEHPSEIRRLKQGYGVSIRDDWRNG